MANISFGKVIILYYCIAVVMWGGGAIGSGQLGIATEIVTVNESTGEVGPNQETGGQIQNLGGPLRQAAGLLGGGAALAVWGFVKGLVGALFWPVVIMESSGAPASVLAVSGALSMAFLAGTIQLIRGTT